jgi:hypothetical protein
MDSTIVVAIIGSATTILSPIATFLGTRYFDNRDKLVMTFGQRAEMTGEWRGTTNQETGEYSSISFPTVVTVVAKGKIITGKFRLQLPEHGGIPAQEDHFTFQGGFLYDRFLQFDYISTDKRRVQFGSIILELSPYGDGLSGRYAGYGAFSEQIIAGSLELKRAP